LLKCARGDIVSLTSICDAVESAAGAARSAAEVAERNEMALFEARRVLAEIEKGLKQISRTSEPSTNDYAAVLTLGPDPRTAIQWPIHRFDAGYFDVCRF
jgi:hypothetical protein